MPANMATEPDSITPALKGTKANPAREPKKRPLQGKGSIGDIAFTDACIIVGIAWGLLLLLWLSVRSHNI